VHLNHFKKKKKLHILRERYYNLFKTCCKAKVGRDLKVRATIPDLNCQRFASPGPHIGAKKENPISENECVFLEAD